MGKQDKVDTFKKAVSWMELCIAFKVDGGCWGLALHEV
jgi:hypothetical protein